MDEKKRKTILRHITAMGLAPPRVLTIMITNGCNLSCRHCWPDSRCQDMAAPVPKEQLLRLIRSAVHLGLEEICLTGGEPLTHPHWFEVLRFACRLSGFKTVRLQTNATLLGMPEAKALASVDFKGLTIQVSLEGTEPSSNDRVRGPGNFERAFQGLKRLVEAGLGSRTVVAFTEAEHNFEELPRLLKRLDAMGIGRLESGTLVKAGRAAEEDELALPGPSQYRELLKRYHDDPEFRERYRKMGNIACLEWFRGRSNAVTDPCICMETPYITADGRMYPCLMLPMERYQVQGVHDRPFEDVLMDGVSLWAEIPSLYRRREKALEACIGCPGRIHCAGGCLGRAYASAGDPMTVEDRCALRRAVYSWEAPSRPGHKQKVY
ncbi:radical SAM/SPASM domain-containing protein [Thermodesulfobacteriota bacterium]